MDGIQRHDKRIVEIEYLGEGLNGVVFWIKYEKINNSQIKE